MAAAVDAHEAGLGGARIGAAEAAVDGGAALRIGDGINHGQWRADRFVVAEVCGG